MRAPGWLNLRHLAAVEANSSVDTTRPAEMFRNGTTFSVGRTDRPLFQSQDSGVSQTRERSDRLGSPASGSAADSHLARVGARAHSHVASRPAMT